MPAPLSAEAKSLIDRPNFAHLATLMADGSPQTAPVWIGREGDRLLVCTSEGSLKGRNTRRPDPDLKTMDPLSRKYTGKPFPMRSPEGRVALVIEVDKARYTKLPFTHTPPPG